MKCRLSIAKWRLLDPGLLLLDEPYGVLDGNGVDLLETFLRAHCAKGHIVIMASHHVARALNLCGRALILHQGRLHFDEPKQTPWPAFDRAFGDFLPRGGPMTLVKQAYLLLWKDLLLEMRRRDSLLTMFFFGTLLLFVFHFAFDMPPDKVAELAPALLWLAFLFTGTLGLAQLFQAERDNHCLDALLLSPLDRGALFLAKTGFNLDAHARGRSRRHPVVLDLVQFVRRGTCYRNSFW